MLERFNPILEAVLLPPIHCSNLRDHLETEGIQETEILWFQTVIDNILQIHS